MGVPGDAVRCEIVRRPRCPARWRKAAIALVTSLVAGGVATAVWISPFGGVVLAIVGLELLEFVRVVERLEPAAMGGYLAFEVETVDRDASGWVGLAIGTMSIALGVAGVLGIAGPHDWMGQFGLVGGGLFMVRLVIADPRPTLRFRAMADPSHPLGVRGTTAQVATEAPPSEATFVAPDPSAPRLAETDR